MSTCCPARWPGQSGTLKAIVLTCRVSTTTSTTSAAFQVSRPSTAVPAMDLRSCCIRSSPKAGLVKCLQPQTAYPLGALPEVEVRDEHARRSAVLRVQRLALVLENDPGLAAGDVSKREVRRVAAIAVLHDVFG